MLTIKSFNLYPIKSRDPVGAFYRKKTIKYDNLFRKEEADLILRQIETVSKWLIQGGHTDCTKLFKYDKCC